MRDGLLAGRAARPLARSLAARLVEAWARPRDCKCSGRVFSRYRSATVLGMRWRATQKDILHGLSHSASGAKGNIPGIADCARPVGNPGASCEASPSAQTAVGPHCQWLGVSRHLKDPTQGPAQYRQSVGLARRPAATARPQHQALVDMAHGAAGPRPKTKTSHSQTYTCIRPPMRTPTTASTSNLKLPSRPRRAHPDQVIPLAWGSFVFWALCALVCSIVLGLSWCVRVCACVH